TVAALAGVEGLEGQLVEAGHRRQIAVAVGVVAVPPGEAEAAEAKKTAGLQRLAVLAETAVAVVGDAGPQLHPAVEAVAGTPGGGRQGQGDQMGSEWLHGVTSAAEGAAGGVIAAVHLAVAVAARLPDEIDVPLHLPRRIVQGPGMAGGDMALLAEERLPGLEQLIVDRGVGQVAMGAVVLHRLVLEQEGAALFGVALVAGVVDRGLGQAVQGAAAVGGVAVAALHMALRHGVAGEFQLVGLFSLVAVGAHPELAAPLPHRIGGGVDGVAAGAAHPGGGVLAKGPVGHGALLVTGEAGAVAAIALGPGEG